MHIPLLIGIAGGAGSGKTTLVGEIIARLKNIQFSVIPLDSYYKNQSTIPLEKRSEINYDHPDTLDTALLFAHLALLLQGKTVAVPVYDFQTHTRKEEPRVVEPGRVIVIEGIMVLAFESLRRIMDIKIFVDTEADIRFIRRLQRDIRERGRTLESVVEQYQTTVKPMHLQFVEPSKSYADIIVLEGGLNRDGIKMIIAKIESGLEKKSK